MLLLDALEGANIYSFYFRKGQCELVRERPGVLGIRSRMLKLRIKKREKRILEKQHSSVVVLLSIQRQHRPSSSLLVLIVSISSCQHDGKRLSNQIRKPSPCCCLYINSSAVSKCRNVRNKEKAI